MEHAFPDWRHDYKRIVYYSVLTTGLLYFILDMFLSNGSIVSRLLFYDRNDYLMDFFNVLHYVHNRQLYLELDASYPPLAYIVFYIMKHMIPISIVAKDGFAIRSSQIGMFIYSVYTTVTTLVLYTQVYKLKTGMHAERFLFCTLFFLSAPYLYQLDRGNILIIALIFLLFFILYKDAEHWAIREIALICLGISAGIKLYPAIFGFLLLKERRFSDAIRTAVYGLGFILVPFAFWGGPKAAIAMVRNITGFSDALQGTGFGFKVNISNTLTLILSRFGLNDPKVNDYAQYGAYLLLLAGLAAALFLRSRWKTLALLAGLMISVPNFSFMYSVIFMIVPVVFFLNERKRFNGLDLVYLLLFICQFLPLAVALPAGLQSIKSMYPLTLSMLLESFSLLIMILLLTAEGLLSIHSDKAAVAVAE